MINFSNVTKVNFNIKRNKSCLIKKMPSDVKKIHLFINIFFYKQSRFLSLKSTHLLAIFLDVLFLYKISFENCKMSILYNLEKIKSHGYVKFHLSIVSKKMKILVAYYCKCILYLFIFFNNWVPIYLWWIVDFYKSEKKSSQHRYKK